MKELASPFVFLVVSLVPFLIYRGLKFSRTQEIYVRKIDGIKAIDAACGRSAEEGRPISFTTGLTPLSPVLYACLGVLSHVTQLATRYKNKLLLPQTQPDVMAVTEELVKESITRENRFASGDIAQFYFLSDEQFAFASGYVGLIQREHVGAAFLFGSFAAESLVLAEAGQQIGAMQIAGAITPEQVPFFIVSTDYTLIGEELFAASAYLTRESVQLGSLYAQDRLKAFFLLLIIGGVISATLSQLFPQLSLDLISLIKSGW
jgi:hypothetical protein